ncbi:unnamed protein product [Albugo candida]|uniref:Aldehyde dehydrogenase domain-containing protein n=1 Tax=Albugo candida TaxID=65357 RepID=A0A024G8B5_9STRA|nr:unnamed protein product [Albugo candida]|eukprot:CCI43121.1 unnamed protein product [Albugo candida]
MNGELQQRLRISAFSLAVPLPETDSISHVYRYPRYLTCFRTSTKNCKVQLQMRSLRFLLGGFRRNAPHLFIDGALVQSISNPYWLGGEEMKLESIFMREVMRMINGFNLISGPKITLSLFRIMTNSCHQRDDWGIFWRNGSTMHDAISDGPECALDGSHICVEMDRNGNFVRPTILINVSVHNIACIQEIFVPVL